MEKQKRITLNADKRKVIADVFQNHFEDNSKFKKAWQQAKETYNDMRSIAKTKIDVLVRTHQPQEDVDTIRAMNNKYGDSGGQLYHDNCFHFQTPTVNDNGEEDTDDIKIDFTLEPSLSGYHRSSAFGRSYYREEMKAKGEKHQKLSRENKIAGQEFLDQNKTKEGVLVRRSNLQFKEIVRGTGIVPDYDDVVTVHYTGYLVDGHKFDSSYDRGEPAIFPVKGVIPGWTEILQIMPVGSKWEVYIPYNLAYGERGIQGPEKGTYVIPPSATLIFEIELLGISD